jgi:ribose transport system substrate-binding protein
MVKKITVVLFLFLGITTVGLIIQLHAILGNISGNLAFPTRRLGKPKDRIAFIYQKNNGVFWNQIKQGAANASQGEHVYVNFMEEIYGQELQLPDYLRLAIEADYDGIIIQGEDVRMITLIQEAGDSGIPVLMIASDLPGSGRVGYVGTNNYRAGYIAGKTLLRNAGPASKSRFAVLSPLAGSDLQMPVAESIKIFGFREAVSSRKTTVPIWEKSDATLIDSILIVRNLLRKYPDLDGIYATYSEGTLAAAKVVQERNATDRIRIIGYGDSPLIREYIKNGVLSASIVEDPFQIGHAAVKEMTRYFREGQINISNNIDVIVLNRTNLQRYKERDR